MGFLVLICGLVVAYAFGAGFSMALNKNSNKNEKKSKTTKTNFEKAMIEDSWDDD